MKLSRKPRRMDPCLRELNSLTMSWRCAMTTRTDIEIAKITASLLDTFSGTSDLGSQRNETRAAAINEKHALRACERLGTTIGRSRTLILARRMPKAFELPSSAVTCSAYSCDIQRCEWKAICRFRQIRKRTRNTLLSMNQASGSENTFGCANCDGLKRNPAIIKSIRGEKLASTSVDHKA